MNMTGTTAEKTSRNRAHKVWHLQKIINSEIRSNPRGQEIECHLCTSLNRRRESPDLKWRTFRGIDRCWNQAIWRMRRCQMSEDRVRAWQKTDLLGHKETADRAISFQRRWDLLSIPRKSRKNTRLMAAANSPKETQSEKLRGQADIRRRKTATLVLLKKRKSERSKAKITCKPTSLNPTHQERNTEVRKKEERSVRELNFRILPKRRLNKRAKFKRHR